MPAAKKRPKLAGTLRPDNRVWQTSSMPSHVTFAAACYLFLLCPISSSSDVASSGIKVALVAPLYIANHSFSSILSLTNKADSTIAFFVTFDSLEGEETARSPTTLPPHSSITIDVDSVPKNQRLFAGLGSISILAASPAEEALAGRVTITSRAGMGKIHIEEDLQPVNERPGPLRVGFVSAPFSVPVLAVRSLSQLSQRMSIICSDSAGGSYESQLLLPAHTTFLLNACIRGKEESRTYRQLLSGDTGPMRGDATIEIKTADPQGAISVWGFAAANTGAESAPRVIGIEFTEWDTGLEFLLGMGRGLPSLSAF